MQFMRLIPAFVLLAALPTTAQTPTPAPVKDVAIVVKENPVPAGSFAEVVIEGLGPNSDKIVDITPSTVKQVEVNGTIYFSGLEAKYTVEVIVVNFDTKKISRKKLVVTFAQNPQPPPNPDPKPEPPGPVTPTKFKIVIVEETEQAVAERGAFLASTTLAAYLREKGHSWRVVDKDVTDSSGKPPADIAKYIEAAKGKTLAQVFLIDSDGKLRHQGNCNFKVSEMIELLKKNGG